MVKEKKITSFRNARMVAGISSTEFYFWRVIYSYFFALFFPDSGKTATLFSLFFFFPTEING